MIRALPVLLALAACHPVQTFDEPPVLEVGTGEFAFEPVADGDELPIVFGPQGGYHVFLGVRAERLDPFRVRLLSQLHEIESDEPVGFEFFFDVELFEAEDGSFQTAGLPHQVDKDEVRGKLLRLEVHAVDRADAEAVDDMRIVPVRK